MKTVGPVAAFAMPALLLAACQGNQAGTPANAAQDLNSATAPGNMAGADAGNAMAPASATAPTDAATYIAQTGAGDMFEIESSKAVLDKTKNAKVRAFAQMMIKQHQESTAKVKAAAAEAKLTVAPPALMPDQQAMLDEIKAADVGAVDAVYGKHQKTAHSAALALHEGYAASGDTPALKKAAGEIAPVVKQHIAHLADLPTT